MITRSFGFRNQKIRFWKLEDLVLENPSRVQFVTIGNLVQLVLGARSPHYVPTLVPDKKSYSDVHAYACLIYIKLLFGIKNYRYSRK